jgi:hypothetical protein
MKPIRTLALFLGASMLALTAPAQEAAAPLQLADHVTAAPLESLALPDLSTIATAPAVAPLVRPVTPQPTPQHKFFDRQQWVALSVHGGVRLADTVVTCRKLSQGATEDWIPTQSCGGIVAWQAGSVALALGVGWLFHKHGHHTLERITPWVGTGASAAGLTKSVFNIH